MTALPLPNTTLVSAPAVPPISAGWVSAQGNQLLCGGQPFVVPGVNLTTYVINGLLQWNAKQGQFPYPTGRQIFRQQMQNFWNAGFGLVRFNDMDAPPGGNWWCGGNGPMTTSMTLDPAYMEAWDYAISVLRDIGFRVLVSLYQARQIQPTDAYSWACPSFTEMTTTPYGPPWPAKVGSPQPWRYIDPGVRQFEKDFIDKLLTRKNQYTGLAPAEDPVFFGWGIDNERSLARDGYFFTAPYFASQIVALAQQFCAAHGIAWRSTSSQPLTSLNKVQTQQFIAYLDTLARQDIGSHIRSLTPALVIGGTYFGTGNWTELIGPMVAGDVVDCHFYSRNATTDANFFQTVVSPAQRSQFAAVLAGMSYGGKPQIASEIGFVAQGGSQQLDPVSELINDISATVTAMINQGVQAGFFYAGGHHGFGPVGGDKVGVYDIRAIAQLMAGMQAQMYRFRDLTLRPTGPPTIVSPTNGLYGGPPGSTYVLYSPNNDPAILAVPAAQQVLVQAAA